MAGCAPTDWTATDCAPANRATGAANSVLEREPHLYIHLAIVSRAATSTPRSEPAGQTPVLSEERRAQIAARRTPVDVIQHVPGVEAQRDVVPPAGRLSCARRTHHARRRRRHHPAARRRSAATAHRSEEHTSELQSPMY